MAIGDLNKKFGWLWLVITPLMGMYISFQFRKPDYLVVTEVAGKTLLTDSFSLIANRSLHVHSGLLAFLNILYGHGIDDVPLADNTKKLGSYLAVVGAILLTLSFFALSVPAIRALSLPSRALAFISVLVAVLIMAAGQLKK